MDTREGSLEIKRRPKNSVLVVEDREENQQLIAATLSQMKIKFYMASNGSEALEISRKYPISIYIVDLMMPVMDGGTFIQKIKIEKPNALIIVQTAIDSSDEVIRIMKMGVYEYLIKPLNIELFQETINKCLEVQYLRDMEALLEEEEAKDLRDQLEWLSYKESSRRSSRSSQEFNSIQNLHTLLNQGSGLGSMTILVDGISDTSVKLPDGNYSVDAEFYQLLVENNKHTKSMLTGLGRALDVFNKKQEYATLTGGFIVSKVSEWSEFILPYLPEKKLGFHLPVFSKNIEVETDIDLLSIAWKEMLLNAYKYSTSQSSIDTFVTLVEGYLCLAMKNTVLENAYGKFDIGQEKDLILPFYRVHPPVETVYKEEYFGMGLGLTMVDHIATKLGGMFFIRNAKDHTTDSTTLCVITEFFIPTKLKGRGK